MDLKKIEYLEETKDLIKQALIEKGAEVTDDDTFRSYADKIGELKIAGENKINKLLSGEEFEITEEDLKDVTTIKSYAFYSSGLKKITIPNNVTSIGSAVFQDCESLTSVTIPNNVTSIGSSSFNGCSNLEGDFDLPKVTSIQTNTFFECQKITSVSFGKENQLTSINQYGFRRCYKLTSITIPTSVTALGDSAFLECLGLVSVKFEGQAPNNIRAFGTCTHIQVYDFRNCTTVPTLYSTNKNTAFGYASGCKIVIPDALYDEWTTASKWVDLTDVVWVKASEYVEE